MKSPAQQIAGFLARYSPEVRREGQAARRALRKWMPTAVELVYDNYNALVFGYGPDEHASRAVLSIALYPRWVTLFFLQGARLADPDGLLEGSGAIVRSIRLERAADLARPQVRSLIAQAIARGARLPEGGRGRIEIRAIAPKQRPRQPKGR